MSKVKIAGHASGSGTLTIQAPDTSSSRTITLPDATGTLLATEGAVTINDSGADVDFRVESDTKTHALFVDGALGNVGLGATPATLYSGYSGLQVGGLGSIWGQTAAAADYNFWIGQNVRAGADGSDKAIVEDESSVIHFSAGRVEFKVAPSAAADANVSWTTALNITNDGRGLSQFTAKAWISFKGTDTIAIHEAHNVSTISDNGTGSHRINFTNDMSSANYCVSATARRNSRVCSESDDATRVVGYVDVTVRQSWTATAEDQEVVSVLVFGE